MPTRIATAEHGGTFWSQGMALRAVLDREPMLAPVEIVTTPGASIGTAERIESGEAALGFMATNWVPRAMRGEAPFARPHDLRVAAPMNVGPLFFIARADAGLASVADLAGKRVVFGHAKSGMAQHAHFILDLLGIAVTPLYLEFAAGAEAVATGVADAQLQCPIPNAVMSAADARADLSVLPYPPGALERVLAAVPFYRRAVMKRGALRALDADSVQPGVLNLLVAHARADDAMVAAVVRAIAKGTEELARLNPLFAGLDALLNEETMRGLVLHDGAAQAYRELGRMKT